MKRTYQTASAGPHDDGYGVRLDGKPLHTPAKALLVVPTAGLAAAIAAEWNDQRDDINPDTMPMTRFAAIALDLVSPRRDAVIDEAAQYAQTDLVCYRADAPPALVRRQQAVWQPLVDWATLTFDAPLAVTSGIVPVAQPPEALRALRLAVEAQDDFRLACLRYATGALGSLVLALALVAGRLDAEAAFDASVLDETIQIETWGKDEEAMARRRNVAADIAACARFRDLLA